MRLKYKNCYFTHQVRHQLKESHQDLQVTHAEDHYGLGQLYLDALIIAEKKILNIVKVGYFYHSKTQCLYCLGVWWEGKFLNFNKIKK